jgi:hypothetical protein
MPFIHLPSRRTGFPAFFTKSFLVLWIVLGSSALQAADAPKEETGGNLETIEMRHQEWLRQAPLLKTYPATDNSRAAADGTIPVGTAPQPQQKLTPALDAAGAVDGLIDGGWGFHTSGEEVPWWQVDLGEVQPIGRVVVYNRCDAPTRSVGIRLLLSDDGKQWREVFRHRGAPFFGRTDRKPLEIALDNESARLVRLALPEKDFFHLDEVQVYAPDDAKENLALEQPAMQSSVSEWSHPPGTSQTRIQDGPLARESASIGVSVEAIEAALVLTRKTLDYVGRSGVDITAWEKQFRELRKQAEAGIAPEASTDLYLAIRRLRRDVILSHPLLDFEQLLITKRPPAGFSHQSDQYLGRHSGIGDGLVVLEDWKSDRPIEKVLLEDHLPEGSVLHPDLSFDGKKILFSYCNHAAESRPEYRRFFIWEIGVDGKGLRQITGTADDPLLGAYGRETVLIEDFDPCYLADGRIAFVSTRNQGGVRCHHGGRYCPTYTLYRCDADGSNIVPLVHGEANEWDPSMLPDGRILWTRWDYINRHDTIYQSLWTIRPDGTGTAHFYGNYTINPCSLYEAKVVPGSHKVVATAGAHHHYTAGSLILVDQHQGQDGPEPIERITPEFSFPETEHWPQRTWPDGAIAGPVALSEDLFLVAYSTESMKPQGRHSSKDAFSIFLVDRFGGRELIYRDPTISCFSPIPVVPREKPPVLPTALPDDDRLDAPDASGRYYVQNVYQSTEKIPEDSVKKIRVVRIYEQPTQRVPDRSATLFELPKEILGTAPVAEDGSVGFEAPAGVPLLFQLVDENEMAVMSMRSFVYLQPDEEVSCVGCHEPRHGTPYSAAMPQKVTYHSLEKPVGPKYEGGLSFTRTVQPVLDRYCIECHGLESTEGGLNLLGTMRQEDLKLGRIQGSVSYDALTQTEGLVSIAYRNHETPRSKPMDYFSHAGRLGKLLLEGDEHHPSLAERDREAFLRVIYWLDLNAQYFGDYSWNKQEWRQIDPDGEKMLRGYVGELFGSELANQPIAALANISLPSESRLLKAPLPEENGGWGQIAGGWDRPEDPRYQKMAKLIREAYEPVTSVDVLGTCNQEPCECRSCWIRRARAEYRMKVRRSMKQADER